MPFCIAHSVLRAAEHFLSTTWMFRAAALKIEIYQNAFLYVSIKCVLHIVIASACLLNKLHSYVNKLLFLQSLSYFYTAITLVATNNFLNILGCRADVFLMHIRHTTKILIERIIHFNSKTML